MYKIVDLFSGIGGFSYAAEQIVGGFETIAFVERDEYCQKVLRKHWHDVPIYSDIRSFNGKEYKDADIVVGGFPCQPWSVAGSQRGSEDDRDLWHEMVRIIEDIRPRWVIGENVSGFVTMPMGLRRSLVDLESIGYKAIPYLIPAAAVDAKHRRMRCWIVAFSECDQHINQERGGFEEANRIQKERGKNDSPSRQFSRTNSVWQTSEAHDDWKQTDIFDLMANANSSDGGNRTDDEDISNKGWESSKAGRESLQSKNRQTRSSNFESSSQSLANANNNGHEGGCVETRNQTSTGQNTQSKWRADTEVISRQSNDGRDKEKSTTNENIRGSRDDCSSKLTTTTGVRSLSERTNNNQGVVRENGYKENNNRTLVSQGSKGVQSSQHRGLGEDKATSKSNQVRSTNDGNTSKGVDNKEKGINVADTNDKGVRTRIDGSDYDLQKEGRGGGDDRTTSRADVGLHSQTTKNGKMGLSEKGDVPYTHSKGLQGLGKHGELERESSKNESTKKSIQGSNGADFRREPITWQPEPNVGRVAHGISNRVHRLRCLGNSIVPQVVARIFYAIKEADNDSKV